MFLKKAAFTLCTFAAVVVNAANFTVANTSDQPINVGVQVPAKTVACINLMPIAQLKKMSQQELQEELIKAVIRDSAEDIKALVLAGADVNYEYTTIKVEISNVNASALSIAIRYNKKKAAGVLMELGANITADINHSAICLNDKQSWQSIRQTMNFKDHAIGVACKIAKYFHDDSKGFRAVLEDCIAIGLDINNIWSFYLEDVLLRNAPMYNLNFQEFLDLGADPNLIITGPMQKHE